MKKVIIIILSGIIIFVSISLIMNKCTNDMRKTIENEIKQEIQVEETKKYELNKNTLEYNLKTYDDWCDYLNYINENYVDVKFNKFAEIESIADFNKDFPPINSLGIDIKKSLIRSAQENIFQLLLTPNGDWTDLPITDNIRKKFKEEEGVLGYYNLPTDLMEKGNFGYNNFGYGTLNNSYSIRIKGNPNNALEPMDLKGTNWENLFPNIKVTYRNPDGSDYVFNYVIDEKGYFDNIYYLGNMGYYEDDTEVYDLCPLDNINDIKECILEICSSEEYLIKKGDNYKSINEHISKLYDYCMEYKYRNKILEENGILPIKNIIKGSLKVEQYDNNTHKAVVSVEVDNEKIYYDIELFIDDKYNLTDAKVELYKEEKK